MEIITETVIEITTSVIIFIILFFILKFVYKKLEESNSRLLNPKEFLPEEEIHTLQQVWYLVMMLLLFIIILYILIYTNSDSWLFAILDIIISMHIILRLDYSSWKNRTLFLFLLPIGSITFITFGYVIVGLLDYIHIPALIYFMKVYYDKFKQYTETNSLGITIVLLFTIIFISFINTTIVENVNPLDSMVMVSNAFTSNGYAILGKSAMGKLNSIFLVWGGYVLSGVGTATLTAAIMTKHFNKRMDKLEKLIKDEKE